MAHSLQVGKPVTGIDFIGRTKEIAELCNLLRNGQSVVLIAPRRFGKTSLVFKILELLQNEGELTAYLDIFTTRDITRLSEQLTSKILENKKLDNIIQLVKKNLSELIKNVEFRSTIEEFDFVLKYAKPESDPWELLENSIDFADKFSLKYQKQLIIGLDEFGDIEKLGGTDVAKMLRAKMQTQKNVSYIFSGSYESVMDQLFTTAKSPFYRFARIVHIGCIDPKTYKKYYTSKLNQSGIKVNNPLIDKLLDFTGGHPYYSSLVLQHLLLVAELPNDTQKAYNLILTLLLDSEKGYLEKLWEDISGSREQRTVLLALAESLKPYSAIDVKLINISRTIHALLNKGLILKTNKGYVFSDPLFQIWIRKEVLDLE
jgi:hypothetical protein